MIVLGAAREEGAKRERLDPDRRRGEAGGERLT